MSFGGNPSSADWAFEQMEFEYWMNATFEKALGPLVNRIYNLLMRSLVHGADDSESTQGVTVEYAEGKIYPNCERLQPYGFTSVPLPGSLGLMQGQGGHTDAAIITMIDDQRHRITNLQPGEIAFYTHKNGEPHGHRIVFKNDGSIEVFAKSIKVTAEEAVTIDGGKELHLEADNISWRARKPYQPTEEDLAEDEPAADAPAA